MRLSKKLVIAALGSATLVLNPLAAFAAGPTIEDTDGPLVRIAISDTLNCSNSESQSHFYHLQYTESQGALPVCQTNDS